LFLIGKAFLFMTGTSHVLARKYRPQTFADLVGQDALVQTITNAIASNRLAHAYMLTGIRGIGKTTSARIIAKGLNCIGPDGKGGMTPNPCGQCKHCLDIANDSHIDVIEIDAASNTGVDNVREIIEGAKYNPVSARFKIYIIDEVHMLSKQAFNALLKTLEEPPERIKFIFATTEIRKVPITILSRCQRFDLRRLDESVLTDHLAHIAALENVTAEREALQLIARAGDGSCRDSLSLLDQAITQFDGTLTQTAVRQMLGLADRTKLFDLYHQVMGGEIAAALTELNEQYARGADPVIVAQDLLDLTHWLTRVKIVPDLVQDITVPEAERVRGKEMATALSMASLTAAWQLLLKGLNEVKTADNPLQALEMVLVRLAYLADVPSPAQVVDDIKKNGLVSPIPHQVKPQMPVGQPVVQAAKQAGVAPAQRTTSNTESEQVAETRPTGEWDNWKDIQQIADFARKKSERILAFNIENYIRPIRIEPGHIVCGFGADAPRGLSADLVKFLDKETGLRWIIKTEEAGTAKTAKEVQTEKRNNLIEELKQTPVLNAVVKTFPGVKIEKVTQDKTEELPAEEPGE